MCVGLVEGVSKRAQQFTVNTMAAGPGPLVVDVSTPGGTSGGTPVEVTDQKDGIHLVRYTPSRCGDHIINITFAGSHITGTLTVT